jgi:hypothetical protein
VRPTFANLSELAAASEKRKVAEAERAVKHEERTKEREEQWAKERAEERRLKVENLPPIEDLIRAEPKTLADSVGMMFGERLGEGEAPQVELPPELAPGRTDSASGAAVRLRWVEDLLLQKPQLTSTDCQMAMYATFGIGLNNVDVTEALKAVRELNGMRYITRTRQPAPEPIAAPVPAQAAPKASDPQAPRLLEFIEAGVTRYLTTTVAGLQKTITDLKLGQDAAFMVWRPAKTKVTVVVSVEDDGE